MIPASSTLRAAISSAAREPVLEVTLTLGETDYTFHSGMSQDMITGFSLSRTPNETAIRASMVSGGLSAQCNFTLQGWQATVDGDFLSSSDLSIYKAGFTALRDNGYGLDALVRVRRGFKTSAGRETVQVFVGYIDKVSVSGGDVSFLCLDLAVKLQGEAHVPALATNHLLYTPATAPQSTYGIKVQEVVALILRSGGYLLTPRPTGNVVLSAPASIPEIGHVDNMSRGGSIDSTTWSPTAGQYPAFYDMTETYTPRTGRVVIVEGWFYMSSAANADFITVGQLQIYNSASGHLEFGVYQSGWFETTVPVMSGRTYLYIEIEHTATGTSWYVRTNGTDYSGVSTAALTWPAASTDDTRVHIERKFEGMSVRLEHAGQFTRVLNDTWTPNYSAVWDDLASFSTRNAGTPPAHVLPAMRGKAWDLLNEIARSVGARFRWREDGVFYWQSRKNVKQKQFGTASALYNGNRALIGSGYEYEGASRRKEVVADVAGFSPRFTEVDTPIWTAPDEITIPSNTTQTLEFTTDRSLLSITTIYPSSHWVFDVQNPQVGYSRFTAVRAADAGDPSAIPVSQVSISALITENGFSATISNGNSFEIALWDPAGGPGFAIYGSYIDEHQPRKLSAKASPKSTESLPLPTTAWNQNLDDTQDIIDSVAAETALPAIVFGQQVTVSDPTLTVEDVIDIQDEGLMDGPVRCQVVGIDSDMDEDILTVVPVIPPTGWVLGYTGRSELGSVSTATAIIVA